jgi:hypothetical protein
MTTLASVIESDFDSIYDSTDAAVSVVYRAGGVALSAGVTMPAFVQFKTDLGAANSGLAAFAEVSVRKSLVARPAVYDIITYNSADYEVLQILSGNKHSWLLWAFADARSIPSNLQGV